MEIRRISIFYLIMAKKYIVKRYYKRRSNWSSNINKIINQVVQAPASSEFYGYIPLTRNPEQSDTSVSQQYTVKNVEFSFDISGASNATIHNIEHLTVYIIYVPQGFTVDSTIINKHPEWIMAYRYLGGPDYDLATSTNSFNFRNPLRVKSRLARRLQTGDSIYWLVTGVNETTADLVVRVNGIVRWWTKAN